MLYPFHFSTELTTHNGKLSENGKTIITEQPRPGNQLKPIQMPSNGVYLQN